MKPNGYSYKTTANCEECGNGPTNCVSGPFLLEANGKKVCMKCAKRANII